MKPNTMQENLQNRLQREVREKMFRITTGRNASSPNDIPEKWGKELDTLISHTIAETIKEGVSVIEGTKNDMTRIPKRDPVMREIAEIENEALQTAVTKLQELLPTNDRSV